MRRSYLLLIALLFLLGSTGFAQEKSKDKYKYKKKEFCSANSWSNGERVSANDLRESTIAAPSVIKVDSKNGRITVKGANRSDVLVRACVRTWAKSEGEANSLAKRVNIVTSPTIHAQNTPERNWSVSYEIHVPRNSNLDLRSSNGRISIHEVKGQINFRTSNGRITLGDVEGDVKGKTNNGRVTVKLSGSTFDGNGLDVKTNNGRISLYIPTNFSANVEAGTGNGKFSSDFEALSIKGKKRKYGSNKVSASINGGGAPIRVTTGNGRVSIHSTSK